MQEFIAACRFWESQGGTSGEDPTPWIWAATDASIYQAAGYNLRQWVKKRLEPLPKEIWQNKEFNEIYSEAQEILMTQDSGGRI